MRNILLFFCIACIGIERTHGQTGIPVPEMAHCDSLMNKFLKDYEIPGATFALAKDGKIVYMRAFGFSNMMRNLPTQPHNLFRIASLSKQVTSVAIMKLIEDGRLHLGSKVFGPGSIFSDHPVYSKVTITDTRIYDITVQNLLEHSAGWDRTLNCNPNPTTPYPGLVLGCDPTIIPLHVTEQTGTPNPVTGEAIIQFSLQQGLHFTPNTKYSYSNVGYLILGKIIEQITGQKYEDYVKNGILAPLGIYDMHIGNTLLSEKQEREGEYIGYGPRHYYLSAYGTGRYVPLEYGGYHITAREAHGGWIATARDIVRLLVAVDGFATKPDILKPATITSMTAPSANRPDFAKGWFISGSDWYHSGSLPGTASIITRTGGGYTWVIILNKHNIEKADVSNALYAVPWNCVRSTSSWPAFDLMESPTINASDMTFSNVTSNSVTVSWTRGNGNKRLLLIRPESPVNQFPLDGTDYAANQNLALSSPLGAGNYIVYNDTGTNVTVTGLTPCTKYHFRVIEYNKNAVTGNNALYQLGNNAQSSTTTGLNITSKPAPQQANQCDSTPVNFSIATVGDSLHYQWKVDGTIVGSNQSTLSYNPSSLGVGLHTVRVDVTDSCGSNFAETTLTIHPDNKAPTITNASASPSVIDQKNHKMVTVKLNYTLADNCGAGSVTSSLAVSSNEPVNGCGSLSPDWMVIDKNTVQLRAERCGHGSDRIYTIAITAKDERGNAAVKYVTLKVRRDKGKPDHGTDPWDGQSNGLRVWALPNPTRSYFTLILRSNSDKKIDIQITDMSGRVVETKRGIAPNTILQLGHKYRPGVYFAHVVQGSRKVTVKLMKHSH